MIKKETLKALRAAQITERDLSADVTAKRSAFEESIRVEIEAQKRARETLVGIIETAKAEALAEYEETGLKKLSGGLGVRLKSSLDYEPGSALEFAKKHSDVGLLVLDKKAFETAASGLKLDFVTVVTTPTITIPAEVSE